MFRLKKSRKNNILNTSNITQTPVDWLKSVYNSGLDQDENDDGLDLNEIEKILVGEKGDVRTDEKIDKIKKRRTQKVEKKNIQIEMVDDSLGEAYETDGFLQLKEMLEAIMTDDPETAEEVGLAEANVIPKWLSENLDFKKADYDKFEKLYKKFRKSMYDKELSLADKVEKSVKILLHLDTVKNRTGLSSEILKSLEDYELDIRNKKAACEFDLQKWNDVIATLEPVKEKCTDLSIIMRYARTLKILERPEEAREYFDVVRTGIANPDIAQRYTIRQLQLFNQVIQKFDRDYPDMRGFQSNAVLVVSPVVFYDPRVTPIPTYYSLLPISRVSVQPYSCEEENRHRKYTHNR
ncbi:MAG: hypothetical protein U1E78_06185 [Gammaproteobacteria bacterium]